MHYLHIGDQVLHYIIEDDPTQKSLAHTDEPATAPSPLQHWQWEVQRDQPLPVLLQRMASDIPCPPHTPLHVVVNGSATIVPMADFDEEQCQHLLDYVLPHPSEDSVRCAFYDVLPASNAVLLFGLSQEICNTIDNLWNNVYYVSAQTGLLRRFAAMQETAHEQRCFIHVRRQHIDVACFEGTDLLGFNTFDARHMADGVYYACQMATTLGLTPSSTPFYLCGMADRCAALSEILHDYVSHLEVAQTDHEFAHHPLTTIPQLPFELLTHILSA